MWILPFLQPHVQSTPQVAPGIQVKWHPGVLQIHHAPICLHAQEEESRDHVVFGQIEKITWGSDFLDPDSSSHETQLFCLRLSSVT